MGNKYTIRQVKNAEIIDDAYVEVERSTAGFMMIRRHVFEKIIEQAEFKDQEEHLYGRKSMEYMNLYNFFDFKFNAKSGQYTGEDFNFCKLARNCGFKIYAYTKDYIAHCGRHEFTGRYYDEFVYDFKS